MADESVRSMPDKGETYTVYVSVGNKAGSFPIEAPNDTSVAMAMAFVAAMSYPNLNAVTIEHRDSKRLVAFCPFIGVIGKIAPILNQLGAQKMVIPAARVTPTEKGQDLSKMMEDARKAQSEKGGQGNDG